MPAFSRIRLILVAAAVSVLCLVSANPAGAAIGNWTRNTFCPVDAPAMLASPPGSYTACVSYSGGGPWKLGTLRLRGSAGADFGTHGPSSNDDDLSLVPGPRHYASTGDIDGVYLNSPISQLCPGLPGSRPYDPDSPYAFCLELARQTDPKLLFTPYFESAGNPSRFRLSAVSGTGPVLILPVKVRLASPALGPKCYIGSDALPIFLRLASVPPLGFHSTAPDANGFPVTYDGYDTGALTDTTFKVPAVRGCGSSLMRTVLDLAFGLPSPSGNNSVSLYRAFSLHSTAAGGLVLSQAYHAALGP
jgi:hypothetical protein